MGKQRCQGGHCCLVCGGSREHCAPRATTSCSLGAQSCRGSLVAHGDTQVLGLHSLCSPGLWPQQGWRNPRKGLKQTARPQQFLCVPFLPSITPPRNHSGLQTFPCGQPDLLGYCGAENQPAVTSWRAAQGEQLLLQHQRSGTPLQHLEKGTQTVKERLVWDCR